MTIGSLLDRFKYILRNNNIIIITFNLKWEFVALGKYQKPNTGTKK